MIDCNGDKVPRTGIYMVAEIVVDEAASAASCWEVHKLTGRVEYYIDGVPVTKNEHHAAIAALRRLNEAQA